MKTKRLVALTTATILTAGLVAGCGGEPAATESSPNPGQATPGAELTTPKEITLALQQVGEIPQDGNEVQKMFEDYIGTKMNINWIPSAAYDDKINVMIASNEMPQIVRVNYTPTIINAMQSGLFWEIGPYLKEFKNLNAQDIQHYENISVEGKIYGIPNFRPIGRAAIVYRKDWFDTLGLQLPKTLDDWYNIMKAVKTGDPDKNGKDDTYGTVLYKRYNETTQPPLTRIAVAIGGVNRWGVDSNGKFTPEFMTKEYVDTMKLFRRLYEEELINRDFAALDLTEADKLMDNGKVAMKLGGVGLNGKSFQLRIEKIDPKAVIDVDYFSGPQGYRSAGEPGNFGLLAIPKSSVKDENELRQVLLWLDKTLDEPLSTLQRHGVENKHYKKLPDGKVETLDLNLFNREVKPYRDNLVSVNGYNAPLLKDIPVGEKGQKLEDEGTQYAIPNPALTLTSQIYSERGKELDQMIWDAQTKYIMGQIDDAGWDQEVEKWRKAGGDTLIKEYEEAYAKFGKK